MLDGIYTPCDCIVRSFPAHYVHGNRTSCMVRFLDCGPNFFQGIMVIAIVGDELDQIGAVENVLANAFADFFRAVSRTFPVGRI
jgi:hypothetical protein